MKTKSWSYSYTYSNDGKNEKKEVHDQHFDGNDIYKRGFSVDKKIKGNDKTEKFYKYKKKDNNEKKMYGKSRDNNEWDIMEEENGIRNITNKRYDEIYNYKNADSFKHRLNDSLENNNIMKYNNQIGELDKMFNVMGFDGQNNIITNKFNNKNFNSIFEDDFFKN